MAFESNRREFKHENLVYRMYAFDHVVQAYEFLDYLRKEGSDYLKETLRDMNDDDHLTSRINSNFYGNFTLQEMKGRIYEVKDKKYLAELVDKYKSKVATLPATSFILKRRLEFTSQATGSFSFARASNAMYQRTGYYDTVEQTFRPASEVEPIGDKYQHIPTQNPVEIRGLVDSQGRKKVASRSKKVYSKIGQKKRPNAALDLIINISPPGMLSPRAVLTNAIAAIVLADILERGNVKVRIRGMYASEYRGTMMSVLITAKDFTEPLDTNNVALLLGEAGFLRKTGFEMEYASYGGFNMEFSRGLPVARETEKYKRAFLANKMFTPPPGSKESFAVLLGDMYQEYEVTQFLERALKETEKMVSKYSID